ncbi:MAG TPA: sensor domain-containing diguanylate cyclase [Polyangia bacterium]|jgi:diguanylate cyclase (GGDEF)-like protein
MLDAHETLTLLLDLTRDLAADHGLEEALRQVTDAALRLLPGSHASIRLLDDSHTELLAGARSGEGAATRPLVFRRGEGLVGWVAEHGEVVRVDDGSTDPRFKSGAGQGFEVRALLAVPLWSGGKVVGVLSVTASELGVFSADHELLARLLANCSVPPLEKARLERLALTDHHTRAYTQRFHGPCLTAALDRARGTVSPLAVLLLDLDHFKQVNDEHGHLVGDLVLRGFADLVRDSVRRGDVLIRRGGEEFVLVMPDTPEGTARTVAERICQRLRERPLAGGPGVSVRQTVSIGVACWDGCEDAATLERRADFAMYEAKQAGRDRVLVARRPG